MHMEKNRFITKQALWAMSVALLLIVMPFDGVSQEKITLAECYEWAHANYPLIKQRRLIEQAEQYNLSNAAKGWLPQVAVSGKMSYQSKVTKLPFDTEKLSVMLPGFDIPTLNKDQYQMVAEVNQTIWDGGQISSVREMTRAQAVADKQQLDSELYTLNGRVNQLYFGCLLQDELLKQNELLQKELQININRIKGMMVNGVANQSDCKSMEVELLNAKQKAIELKAARTAYGQMLCALIGKPYQSEISLEVPDMASRSLSSEINRPELRALDAKSNFLNSQNKQITAGLMPKIGAFVQGGYGRPGLNMLSNSFDPFYVAGLRLSWNIGKFYTLKNDRRKVETGMKTVEVERETFLFNTRLTMAQQNTEIKKMSDLMQSDESIIHLRHDIKTAAEVKLTNGVISVTDLIREINAEDMAHQTAATHRIQHLQAICNYMNSTNEQ